MQAYHQATSRRLGKQLLGHRGRQYFHQDERSVDVRIFKRLETIVLHDQLLSARLKFVRPLQSTNREEDHPHPIFGLGRRNRVRVHDR